MLNLGFYLCTFLGTHFFVTLYVHIGQHLTLKPGLGTNTLGYLCYAQKIEL